MLPHSVMAVRQRGYGYQPPEAGVKVGAYTLCRKVFPFSAVK